MKIFIVGVSGCLGQNLTKLAISKDYEVFGISRSLYEYNSPNFSFYQCDAKNKTELAKALKLAKPDVVVNTSAKTNVDACEDEREDAIETNVGIVKNLAELCGSAIPLIQISTDYVFDGDSAPYTESSKPNPQGFYGETKHQAEEFLQKSNCIWSVLRTQILFGNGKNLKADFVSWLLKSLKNNSPVKIVTDQIGNPTLASQLAKGILAVIERKPYNEILHCSGREGINRYEFSLIAAEIFGLDKSLISPVTSSEFKQKAKRPANSTFKTNYSEKALGFEFLNPKETLLAYQKEIETESI
ncbi:MAG: SDR family NAD(P)-dependent oxidoreductase [Calditrichaeota bacterium]|nr:MAG: SDR family NAD(P)-dependent oxidoreductase [Calditrichota bacterium]